jgi:O-antigen/teichoic acid export membrane protein
LSRTVSHQVVTLMVGRMLSYAVMFFVPLVNVRTLSVEEYGYYRQFWLIFETLTPILILGFSRSLLYYVPRAEGREERSRYITQTVLFLATGALVAMAVFSLMAQFLGEGLGAAARAFYWRLCFFTLCMIVTDYMEVLFVAQQQPLAQSIYHATVWGVQAVVVIVASYLSRDVSTVIWALTFYALARFCFGVLYTHARYRFSLERLSWASMREQAAFAVPVGLAGIALVLVAQTDKFIISRYLGREAFAIYSVGAFQVPLANIVQTSVGNVTFPLMARYQKAGDFESMRELWQRSLLKTVILFFPIFVFLEVTAHPFITILFTEQYADAAPVFMIYMLLFLRSSIETGTIIQVSNRTVFLAVGFVVGFVVNLGLGLLLFRLMGRLGVPLAVLITTSALALTNLVYSARLIRTSLVNLVPGRRVLIRFGAALLPGVVMAFLYAKWPVTNVYELAIAGLVYSAMYASLVFGARLLTVDDLRSMVGRSRA